MKNKKNVFDIVFKDGDVWDDAPFTLHTTEPKTENEIRSLIYYWAEVNSRIKGGYSPIDILDDLCEDKGWRWEDKKDETIVITDW